MQVLDNIILVVYAFDIVIQFFTSFYVVQTGDEIQKPSKIARRYLFSFDFLIDFLSTFPFRKIEVDNEGYQAFASLV